MARSFSPAVTSTMKEGTYYHQPSDSYFAMLQRDGKFFQQRYQLGPNGSHINVMEKRVDYVMGSGNHARTYLHRTASNTLIELPLGWYAEKGGYFAMNPGYDRPDHEGFRRPISYDCMFCHNGYPKVPAGAAESTYGADLPEGIDCQRCHGSGSRHIALAGTAGARRQDIRDAIVNPARLNADRQLEICMACHLETTSFPLPNALQRFGRGPFSFQPGEPLGDFIVNFDHAPEAGRGDKFEIVSAAYRLRKSACFLQSKGKMLCTTCHNPHATAKVEATACQKCHGSDFDQRVKAGLHTPATNCVDCHMPKRRTEDVIHVVVTDHLIERRPPVGDLLADRPERRDAYRGPVALYYPETLPHTPENELYLALAQVKQGSNLAAGIVQLTSAIARASPARAEWYLELGEALERTGQLDKAVPEYRRAASLGLAKPSLAKLGSALRRSGHPAEAIEVLKKAPASPANWNELGLAGQALGKTSDAVAAINNAIRLDPDLAEAHNNLGSVWLTSGDPKRAEPAFREAIRIRPDYADAHANLADALSGSDRSAEAEAEFEIALRLRPVDAPTRYNYAVLLARMNRTEDAKRELETALRSDHNFADAHLLLGDLLMVQNKGKEAAPHYVEALRLLPNSDRGHLGLGAALASQGDLANAKVHLNRAALSKDASIREQAMQILSQLR